MGTIINATGIFFASFVGLLLKTKLSKSITDGLKSTMGLVLLIVSLGWFLRDFFVVENNVIETRFDLEILLMMIIGVLIGTIFNIDASFHKFLQFHRYFSND